MRRTLFGVAVLALVGGFGGVPAAGAQAHAGSSLGSRLSGHLDATSTSRIVALVDSLAGAGVARAPLTSKALEGVSKRAAGAQIEAAVRRLGSDLMRARAALGSEASEAEVEAGGDALSVGVSPEVLTRIKARRGKASALLPLAALTDLVSRGMPMGQASGTVLALSERHAPDAAFRAVQQRAMNGQGASSAAPPAPQPHAPAGPPSVRPRPPRQ